MRDTIDLLEAIGRDASLRHATASELMGLLDEADASQALKDAVAAQDSSLLSAEFGKDPVCLTQITIGPAHEEEPDEDEDKEEPEDTEHGDGDHSRHHDAYRTPPLSDA